MYAHNVIEDLKYLKKNNVLKEKLYNDGIDILISLINDSQKFHLGSFQDLIQPLGNVIDKKARIFHGDCAQNVRMPYKTCWFDFQNLVDGLSVEEDVPKRGVCVKELQSDLLWVWVVNWPRVFGKWFLTPQNYFVAIGKTIGEHDFLKDMVTQKLKLENASKQYIESCYKATVWPQPISNSISVNKSIEIMEDDHRDLVALNSALMLLNCKNIATEKNKPPEKLNKKRKKNKKVEMFTYKTLRLLLPSNSKQNETYSPSNQKSRIHLCRGHFKNFTKEAPLFGKHTGLYWWQPQVRGEKKKGLIVKDYEVKTNDLLNY